MTSWRGTSCAPCVTINGGFRLTESLQALSAFSQNAFVFFSDGPGLDVRVQLKTASSVKLEQFNAAVCIPRSVL